MSATRSSKKKAGVDIARATSDLSHLITAQRRATLCMVDTSQHEMNRSCAGDEEGSARVLARKMSDELVDA